jgi:hypothetical protein
MNFLTNNVEKLLKKSRLSMVYDQLSDIQIKKQIQDEYMLLIKSSNCKDKMLHNHLLQSILPAVVFYRVLNVNGYDKNKILDSIKNSIFSADTPMAKYFQNMGKLPFFYSLFRIMCKLSLKFVYGKSGWDMRWKINNSHEMAWDCHSCFYEKEFRKYGVPDLTMLFCQSDDFIYGDIPNIKWERSKTIGEGAEICDFKFKKNKNGYK